MFQELQEVNYENTMSFIPPITHGKVVKVYDGDTITIATALPYDTYNNYYRFSVRIKGIDCPEMKTKNENEKKCAIMAKDLVISKCLNQIVYLANIEIEKYGRLLADVICNNKSLADVLLNERLAVKYNGKKKLIPTDWMKYYTYGTIQIDNKNDDDKINKSSIMDKILAKIKIKK